MLVTHSRLHHEMVHLISRLKRIEPARLLAQPELTTHDLDIVDVVDIILAVEKKYDVLITDDIPLYSVDDFVGIVENSGNRKLAS
jgi:acyl carrier protein